MFTHKYITTGLIITLLFALVACSSGGNGVRKAARCPAASTYDPLAVNNKAFSGKLELKPGQPLGIPSGDYAYNGSQVYYLNPELDIQLHLKHDKDRKGKMNVTVVCVGGRGITRDMDKLVLNIPIVSDVLINQEGNSQIRTRAYEFTIDFSNEKEPVKYEVTDGDTQYVEGAPFDPYLEYNDLNQYFMTLNGATPARQLVSHMSLPAFNKKLGKLDKLIIRSATDIRKVTEEERNKIDHPEDEISTSAHSSLN